MAEEIYQVLHNHGEIPYARAPQGLWGRAVRHTHPGGDQPHTHAPTNSRDATGGVIFLEVQSPPEPGP